MHISVQDIKLFQTGNLQAFNRIMDTEGCRLMSYIQSHLHSREAAEDLYQEVWAGIWQRRMQLRDPQAFPAWLYQITRRMIRNQIQRHAWEQELRLFPVGDDLPEIPDEKESPRQSLERKQLYEAIAEAFDLLDEQAQAVMTLRYKSNLKLKDISTATNLPLGTVYSKLQLGLVRVGRYLVSRGLVDQPRIGRKEI